MEKKLLSDIPGSLLEEIEALLTLGKILHSIDDIDPSYEMSLQTQDISSIGYLVKQSSARIRSLQGHIELVYRKM